MDPSKRPSRSGPIPKHRRIEQLQRHRKAENSRTRLEEWEWRHKRRPIYLDKSTLDPVLVDFENFIQNDVFLKKTFNDMFAEVRIGVAPYDKDLTGGRQLHGYRDMLSRFNVLLTTTPRLVYTTDGQKNHDRVPTQRSAGQYANSRSFYDTSLHHQNWATSTEAGLRILRCPDVNRYLGKILLRSAEFLNSPASLSFLIASPCGWLSAGALENMTMVVNDAHSGRPLKFEEAYLCDSSLPSYGLTSWDDFFTRRFRPGVRPVLHATHSGVIANVCESAPCRIEKNVGLLDSFLIKSRPYSIIEMLDRQELALQFDGCTGYQAFLSALSYHRWHAPVTGSVRKVISTPGTYFAHDPNQGFDNPSGPDPAAPNKSQVCICGIVTRALIFVEADDARFGLMAILLLGLVEVSCCDVFP